jgi:hypothetical protein
VELEIELVREIVELPIELVAEELGLDGRQGGGRLNYRGGKRARS